MSNCNCKWSGCMPSKIGFVLVVIGAINWGLVGVGMLMNSTANWNVVHMVLSSVPTLEAIVYILVGIAGVMKIFGCRCKKCMAACATCTCSPGNKTGGNM